MHSIRTYLLSSLTIGFTALIIASGYCIELVFRQRVTEEFDSALLAKATALALLTDQEDGQIEFDYEAKFMPEFHREERPHYFQFWLDDGLMLMRSERLEGDLPRTPLARGQSLTTDVQLPDGRHGRLAQLTFAPRAGLDADELLADTDTPPDALGLTLVVALDREHLDALLSGFRLTLFGVGSTALLLAIALVFRTLGRGFRPLESIASQVRSLDADSLAGRVELDKTPTELTAVVGHLNELLERLDAAFDRERRFTGNVAHELRTPIAELRSLANVGRRWPDDAESVARFFGDVHQIAGRMESVIADLLLLARCHAGVEVATDGPTNVGAIIEATWKQIENEASANGVRLDNRVRDGLTITTDHGKFSIVIANLLQNAVSYSSAGTEIRCSGSLHGASFRLEFSNAAIPLTTDELQRLSEPFWRKDDARSSADHAGLGLALVAALADLLGLEITYSQSTDGRFVVTIEGETAPTRIVPTDFLSDTG